ncbi:MAG: sigma-70 family RNA polymerase sigma factor, partial [Verrucomicrobiaceae bacterium]
MKSSASSPGLAGADSDLLRAFATGRDEAAFRALTERYAGLVYGIAFRRLMNAGAAQDVTSEVFTMLAWKAPRLTQTGCLAAWLQRSAVLITANAVRRETRRRLAMNAYTASLEPDPSLPQPGDPAWQEALEHLDESLARLPERDRQLLLARYFTGRTYGEMAVETAAGEEAVKKAGQRALQKLRTLLLRRGVTLPAAVLVSGLTHHVQAATPQGVAFQAASTALRAAALPGLFQTARHSLTYMFYGKTLTAAAAALLLCAALGGGSFLTARQLAMAFSAPPPGSATATVPATTAAGLTGASMDKTAARGVAAIMREAVELLRRSWKETSPEMDRAILLLAGFSPEEMREAAKAAEIYRGDRPLAGALATALGAAWAEQDPAAALGWLEVFPEPAEWPATGGADHIAAAWFERDGQAAWDWWKRRRQSTPPPLTAWDGLIGDGMGHWARENPAAATAALGELDVSPRLLRGFAEHLRQMAIDADSPAVEAALKWRNPFLRVELAVLLAGGLDPFGKGAEELDRVFPLLNRLCADQPGAMETAAAPLMERWVAETPEKAVDWILNETAATS